MKNSKNRGFTIIELVIVIAVIAILAGVLIPTFISVVNKANIASDTALVKNINVALAAEEVTVGKPSTISDALDMAERNGFSVEKLTPRSTGDIVWDSVANRFALVDGNKTIFSENGKEIVQDATVWKIVENATEAASSQTYSSYIKGESAIDALTVTTGVDVGKNVVKAIRYTGSTSGQNVVIRTNSFQTKLTIDAVNDTVHHYGYAWLVDVQKIKGDSYHEFGVIGRLKVAEGHVVAENESKVFCLMNTGSSTVETLTGADVLNNEQTQVNDCGDAHETPMYISDGINAYNVCPKCGYSVITIVKTDGTKSYATSSDTTKTASDDGSYEPSAMTVVAPTERATLNSSLKLDEIPLVDSTNSADSTKHVAVEVTMGNVAAEDITYSEKSTGYTGKGIMLGSTNLNKYAAKPANPGDYTFIFKDGTITSAATGYDSIDSLKDTGVYMLVPGNSDVIYENMTFNGVVSFDIQMYTSPWSYLNSITFKNCTFNGIIVGSCPANKATFDGCTFNNYTNTSYANNSNPIWWRASTGYWGEGSDESVHSLQEFVFINNTVTSTRPVKIERIGWNVRAEITIANNVFDISKQAGDTNTKNCAINIGQKDGTSVFTLRDYGNTISSNTAALYTAANGSGSNQYIAVSGIKILDGNGKDKTITVLVWKTTTGETFEMKTIN